LSVYFFSVAFFWSLLTMTGLRMWRKVEAKGELSHSRNKHTAVVVGSRMLMFGGYSLQQRQFYNDIVSFDFETKEWQELLVSGQAPSKRRAHSCTVMAGGMLVIFGGYNGDYCLNDVHTFDSETHQWSKRECTGEIPAHRGGHTAVAWHGTKMVVHGGWDVGNVYFDCTYVLDTETWSWEKLQVTSAYKPVGRVGHASVLHDQRYLYTFGGYGTEGYWDDLNRLDLRSGQWEIVKVVGDCVPCQRTFSSMEIVGNRILLFGGSNHDVEMNDVMVFDTENHSWEFINCPGQVPEGRFAHVSCMYNHKLYLYGGIVRGSGELNGMYELTLERFTCDHSLVHLLQAWIVHSGMDHRLFADSLPSHLVAQLDAYQQEVTEMRELEAAALGPKAPADALLGWVVSREFVDQDAMEEDEDFSTDGFDDFECDSTSEAWDMAAVEDIVRQMLHTSLGPLPTDGTLAGTPDVCAPECASSSALATGPSSSSSSLSSSPAPKAQASYPSSLAMQCLKAINGFAPYDFLLGTDCTDPSDALAAGQWMDMDRVAALAAEDPWGRAAFATPCPVFPSLVSPLPSPSGRPLPEPAVVLDTLRLSDGPLDCPPESVSFSAP